MLDVAECSIRNAGVHWQRAKHPVRKGRGREMWGKKWGDRDMRKVTGERKSSPEKMKKIKV
jgi:hypothetical protein